MIKREYTIWCDNCGWWEATDESARNMAEATKLFVRKGWKHSRGKSLCPNCIKKDNAD